LNEEVKEMKFLCQQCGKDFEISDKPNMVKFCIHCGKPLQDNPQQMTEK